MRHTIQIGSVFQVPIFMHWPSIAILVGGLLWSRGMYGFVLFPVLLASILFHEYAHVLSARKFGLPTERITLHYFGGAAEINMRGMTPKQEALIAVAGPASSFALALIALGVEYTLNQLWGISLVLFENRALMTIVGLNIVVALFNLIPIFPMDGGRILRAALQTKLGAKKALDASLTVAIILSSTMLIGGIFYMQGLILVSALLLGISILLKVRPPDDETII